MTESVVTNLPGFNIAMIGDRINPGFKSTKTLLDAEDLAGVQALAVRQVEAGASALDVTIGPRGSTDFEFLAKVVRAIQEAVPVSLCFDSPSAQVQEVCFKAYDRARGGPALINSITEQRWEIMDLYKNYGPFRVIVMASERMEDGIAKQNKTADEIASTAKRAASAACKATMACRSMNLYRRLVSAVVADTNSLHRATLTPCMLLHRSALEGLHIMGGLTNIGQQLPPKARQLRPETYARMRLSHFGGAARLDSILCTPWRNYHPLLRRQLCSDRLQEYPSRPAATRCAPCASVPGVIIQR